MKTLVLTLTTSLLLFTPLFSQVKMGKEWRKHQEFFHKAFGELDPDFNVSKAPAKFKDDPVVILSQKLYLGFFSNGKIVRNSNKSPGLIKGIMRKRILIQEKSALADFSEYYFGQSEVMGIDLIKADGSKHKIDLKEAIAVTTEVPKIYKSNFQKTNYYKIAIPNLKVGDILDFYTIFQQVQENNSTSFVTALSSTYPIVYNRIYFDVDKKWAFYYTSTNGAAKFKEAPHGGVNVHGKRNDRVRRLVLEQKDILSQKSERWDYPYLNEPTIKIIAFKYPFERMAEGEYFEKIPAEEFNPKNYHSYYGSDMFNSLKARKNKEFERWETLPDSEIVNNVYNFIRLSVIPEEGLPFERLEGTSEQDNYRSMSEGYFVSRFRGALRDLGINTELVYAVPEYYGPLEQALAVEERVIGVYVRETKKYYFAPNNYSKPGEIPTYLNNAPALVFATDIKDAKSQSFKRAKKVNLPTYTAKENLYAAKLFVTLSDDLLEQTGKLNLTLNNRYRRTLSSMFLFNLKYRRKDLAKFKLEGGIYFIADIDESKQNRIKHRKQAIKRYFEADYAIEELTDFQIIKDGRYGEDPLEVQLDFTSKDLVKKAGQNYIFSAGSLIGEQVELEKEELEKRTKDIHFGTAKLITNEIVVNIPTAYKVEGVENLNFSIDNEYMAFFSEGKLEGDALVITTKKSYKKAVVPKTEWAKVVDILEGAYEFTQAKVVLKKQTRTATVGNR